MPNCALTILLTVDVEKPLGLLDYWLSAMERWNAEALDRVQVIVCVQRPDLYAVAAVLARHRVNADLVATCREFVGGYPIWDVLDGVRRVWPLIRGEYVSFNHVEYLRCPDSLTHTLDWLASQRPYLAVGNLRRTGSSTDSEDWRIYRGCKRTSARITEAMDAGRWHDAAREAETCDTLHWVYWVDEEKALADGWREDVFFARRDWLQAWRFACHGGELPFQDVYDLMGAAANQLQKRKLWPDVPRVPLSMNRLIHVWHEKQWDSFLPAMHDWFYADRRRWEGTAFLRDDLWQRLIAHREANWQTTDRPVVDLRQGPGGTVTRYAVALSQWLNEHGDELTDYYALHGKQRCEVA